MAWILCWVPCIIFFASWTRSTFGFGDSLMAVPLLLLVLPPESVVVVMAGVSLVQGIVMCWQERKELDFTLSAHLILAAAVGVPFGLLGVKVLPAPVLRLIVSVVVLGYATQALLKVKLPTIQGPVWRTLAGFLSGFFGAAINISGPPVVLYGTMAGWSQQKFRVTLQGFFLALGLIVTSGQLLSGMWTIERLGLMALALPAMAVGLWLGIHSRGRLSPVLFERLLYSLLVIMGATLAHQAIQNL